MNDEHLMKWLFEALNKCLIYNCNTLDHKYHLRSYIERYGITEDNDPDKIHESTNSCFKYYEKNKHILSQDISLNAILNLCSTNDHKYSVNVEDKTVTFLSELFNLKLRSNRKLFKCYDCGTNARAFFFSLIKAHRGSFDISPGEINIMKEMYYSRDSDVIKRIKACHAYMYNVKKDTVFICSIGVGKSGHVFIIEKRNSNRYHLYQTSLNSFLLLDYIEQKDYANKLTSGINIKYFFDSLIKLFMTDKWGHPEKLLFTELFSFLPNHEIISPSFSFCWTFLTY